MVLGWMPQEEVEEEEEKKEEEEPATCRWQHVMRGSTVGYMTNVYRSGG